MPSQTVIFGKKPITGRVDSGESISRIVSEEAKAMASRIGTPENVNFYLVPGSVQRSNGVTLPTYELRVSADLETGRELGLANILPELGYCQTPQLCQ